MAMKRLKRKFDGSGESDEINACSIVVPIEVDGVTEEWLVNFKNETHNHLTEIEPFGGAATCLGGAIRDPLSGRTYVYQAMRVTGAADPTVSVERHDPGASFRRRSWCARRHTVTVLMVTRSVWQPVISRRYTIRIMWRSAWRSVQCSVRLRDVRCRD